MSKNRLTAGDRSAAIGLTVAFHLILLYLLLWLTPDMIPFRMEESGLSIFNLPSEKAGAQSASDAEKREKQAEQREKKQFVSPPAPVEKATVPPPKVEAPSMIHLSPEEFAASDIGKLSNRKSNGNSAGGDAANVYGPGEGPGGMQLYNAEWYREPTNAELAGYLPADMPRNGHGLIACQTIENFQVDRCRVLGESPLGSGLGQAVRRAAWQFRVIPPRINGRPQLGVWVRIRIDYIEGVQRLN